MSYLRLPTLVPITLFDTQRALSKAFTLFSPTLFATDAKLAAIRNSTYYQALAQILGDETEQLSLLNNMASRDLSASEAIKGNRFI